MRGTQTGYIKQMSPQKAKRTSILDSASHYVKTSTSLSKDIPTVDVANKMAAVAFPITDGQNLESVSPSTPLPTTGLSLLDAKRRKRNRPSARKVAEPENTSTPADTEKSGCASSKRRKSLTSLKEIAQNTERDTVKKFTNITVPFAI